MINAYSNHMMTGAPVMERLDTEADLIALFDEWERDAAGRIVADSEANALTALRQFGATVRKLYGGKLFVLRTRNGKETTPKPKSEVAALCCAITLKQFGFYPRLGKMKRALVTASAVAQEKEEFTK